MNHTDHVNLLKPSGLRPGGTWADLGAGSGAFTLALRELVGAEAEIHAIDKDGGSLRELEKAFTRRFGQSSRLHIRRLDFATSTELPDNLDGVLMANSLHFFRDKEAILRRVHGLLKPGGTLLLVEYNVDRGNPWVPFPLSFQRFRGVAMRTGFTEPRLLATHPSSFLREFYSAQASRSQR